MDNRGRIEKMLAIAIVIAAALVQLPNAIWPRLFFDDFAIIQFGWDLPTTLRHLWTPHNEHAMPLGRLVAWGLIQLHEPVTTLPLRAAMQGLLAVALATGFVYLFVRREFGQPVPAPLAAALFGLTLKYHQTVHWYAASFWLLGFCTLLIALLAAQRWRQTGRGIHLAMCVLACAAAPGWYAGGVIAGPMCMIYLMPRDDRGRNGWRGRCLALAPLLGTMLFLAISLPQNARAIMYAKHYQGSGALEAFRPWFGIECTLRAVVDTLLFNPVGTGQTVCPRQFAPFVFAAIAAALTWWNWRGSRRIAWLGVALVIGHYFLVFGPRAGWSYDTMLSRWSRYQLVPWFGLVLLIVNGFAVRPWGLGELSRRRAWGLSILAGVLLALHASVYAGVYWPDRNASNEQQVVLQRVAEVERRCRLHRISGADARAALTPLLMPLNDNMNAYDWLHGSDDPLPRSKEEIVKLLNE